MYKTQKKCVRAGSSIKYLRVPTLKCLQILKKCVQKTWNMCPKPIKSNKNLSDVIFIYFQVEICLVVMLMWNNKKIGIWLTGLVQTPCFKGFNLLNVFKKLEKCVQNLKNSSGFIPALYILGFQLQNVFKNLKKCVQSLKNLSGLIPALHI